MKTKNDQSATGGELVIRKVIIAVLMAVSVFSLAFVGINSLVFATATNETEPLPPVTAAASDSPAGDVNSAVTSKTETDGSPRDTETAISEIADEIETPEEFQTPNITVSVYTKDGQTPSANAMDPEDAAQLGAKYIYDMYGESLDGKAVEMTYMTHPSYTRAYWQGAVADSQLAFRRDPDTGHYAHLADNDILYTFILCAVSGERIDIYNAPVKRVSADVAAELRKLDRDEMITFRTKQIALSSEQISEFTQIATDIAQKHFEKTLVISTSFDYAAPAGYVLDEEGKLATDGCLLYFTITAESGREGMFTIDMETKKPENIMTQFNDVVPGYNPGGVG